VELPSPIVEHKTILELVDQNRLLVHITGKNLSFLFGSSDSKGLLDKLNSFQK